MRVIADRNWWVTDDGHRVPDRHPLARRLLVGKGCEIDESILNRYPVLDETSEAKAINEPPETKAISGPWKRKRA